MDRQPENIVIVGAGFGGITALVKLHRALARRGLFRQFNLVLVNKSAQHLYTPALYEIASIPKGEADAVCLKSSICIQIDDIISRFPGIRFVGDTAVGLDPAARRLKLASGEEIPFAYAIVALGAETNFFDVPGLAEHACPLKTFEDAVRLRNRIGELVELTVGPLRIIVGGGGATGVEFSAELINYLCYLKKGAGSRCQEEITIAESAPEILTGFSPAIVRRARRRLERLGVRIRSSAPIASVRANEVRFSSGTALPYHLLVWAGGVRPAAVLKNFGLPLNPKGGVVVNEFLEAAPGVYAIGDNASFRHPKTGKPLPGNVPVAEAQARRAAKNIVAGILRQPQRPFRPLERYPFILAVGGKYALTDLVLVNFSGLLGWVLKQLVELRYLLFILPWPKAWAMWLRAVYYSTRND